MYREHVGPPALSGLVECFWRRELPDPGDDGVILPDGRVNVVWSSGGQVLVAGPQTTFLSRPLVPRHARRIPLDEEGFGGTATGIRRE